MANCDTSYTWYEWTTESCGCTDTGSTWGNWCVNGVTTTTASSSTVWVQWASTSDCTYSTNGYRPYRAAPPKALTPEEAAKLAAEQAARAEAAQIAHEKAEAERKAADERAEKLLRSTLSIRQRRAYHRKKQFVVQAADGVRYRLKKGWAGNVVELDKRGRAINRFCIHPSVGVPDADNLLAQKLLLETDPVSFRRIANRTELVAA